MSVPAGSALAKAANKVRQLLLAAIVVLASSLAISACGGGSNVATEPMDDEGSEVSTEAVVPNPITSVFNGFMLYEEVIRSASGDLNSKRYYRYNSDLNRITRSIAFDDGETIEQAEVDREIELNTQGYPTTITRLNGGEVVLLDDHSFNSAGQLDFRTTQSPQISAPPQQIRYQYNEAGQMISESSSDPIAGGVTSNTDYTFTNGLLTGSVSYFPAGSPVASTVFSNDQSDRISGWRQELSGGLVTSASYTYDENNNIISVEIFDESGALTRTHNYSYVENTVPVYNAVLFQYLYSPQID